MPAKSIKKFLRKLFTILDVAVFLIFRTRTTLMLSLGTLKERLLK